LDLSYVIEKIRNSEISKVPFRHIEINDLFNSEDFERIINCKELTISAETDIELFDKLFRNNYKIMSFPGCVENYKKYLAWHKKKKITTKMGSSCEGYGVVLRLQTPESSPIENLMNLIRSKEFVEVISEKFNIDSSNCTYDSGLQKYLDGYEISPHPDVRSKALTYMVNINPSPNSSEDEHHTSYLKFKPERAYVNEFWKGNNMINRCWVPWSWCDIIKQQRQNNSIVIFSPDNDTLHAVKTNYNHLSNQRTQLYGNLWYNNAEECEAPRWEDFVVKPTDPLGFSIKKKLVGYMPVNLKLALKNIIGKRKKHNYDPRQKKNN